MKLFYRVVFIPLFLGVFAGNSFSQIVFTEAFNYPDGTTVGLAGSWVATCTTCTAANDHFEVRGNQLVAQDVNDWAFWETQSIDISACSDVSFSLRADENGDHDGPGCACGINIDYLDVYYSINGGPYTVIENWNGDGAIGHTLTGDSQNGVFTDLDWQSTIISLSGLVGNSLRLRIELRNTAGSEEMVIDDVSVVCTPLPVEMTSLMAFNDEETVQVVWETAMETGSDRFEIERSHDGSTFFSIGRVAAAGNSATTTSYSFTDRSPINGPAFYRLRQVDLDGSFTHTQVVQVNAHTAPLELAKLYPNPVSDRLNVEVFSRDSQQSSLSVYDLMGNEVLRQDAMLSAGQNALEVKASELAAGMYLLRIQAGSEVLNERFQVR
jgi:hypothetical protein